MLILLLASLGLPIITACLLMLFRGSMLADSARWIALGGTVAAMLAAIALFSEYKQLPVVAADASMPVHPRFEYVHPWFTSHTGIPVEPDGITLQMHLGLDGISVAMILLTTILGVSSVLISWDTIRDRQTEFYAALLALQAGVCGVFCSFDLVLFLAFFEFTLVPLFIIIMRWGGPQRRAAAMKFFLYSFAGSVITLLGLVSLVLTAASAGVTHPTSIPELATYLQAHPLDPKLQSALFLAICAGFLVKVPVFPFHTWLPLTYVEAPTAGTVLASGVLAKLGVFGFLRLCLPFFPDACLTCGLPLVGALSVIGIIYASLCSLAQKDMKRLVAYSSVAHLGFCMQGLFALNAEGIAGGVLQMVNHGLSTAALFLLVGMIYERYHTRQVDELGGLAAKLPLFACTLVFISMASIGLPGLNGFTGEFLALAGMFDRHPLYGALGATGVVLGAWYLLTMLQHVLFGGVKTPKTSENSAPDLNVRELAALAPLVALCLCIGVYPQPILNVIRPDVEAVAALYASADAAPTAALIEPRTIVSEEDAGRTALVSHDLRSVSRDGN